MKKPFIIMLIILFVFTAFALGGCGADRYLGYDYQNGVMLFLDGDDQNFYAEFNFITTSVMASDAAEVDAYLLNVLRDQYGDLIENQGDYYEEQNANGDPTGKIMFCYYYTRPISEVDALISHYRYDPKLIKLNAATQKDGLYYNDYSVEYYNPFVYTGVENPFYVPLQAILQRTSVFNGSFVTMLACSRRDKVTGGQVKAAEYLYWAEFKGTADINTDGSFVLSNSTVGYDFSHMVSWSWYLTVILITGVVIGMILLIAKKRDGKIVDAKPSGHRRRSYGYQPYYGNPQYPPYGNQQYPPYGNPQYPPYGNPQYPPYGNPQYPPYGNPQPPFPNPQPKDVFPGFGTPEDKDGNDKK